MASIRAVWRVGMNNFKTWSANPRIYLIALFLALYLGSALQTLRDYLVATGLPVTPWAIVPLLNDGGAQLFLLAGAVVLFCDAPFLDRLQLNIVSAWGPRDVKRRRGPFFAPLRPLQADCSKMYV